MADNFKDYLDLDESGLADPAAEFLEPKQTLTAEPDPGPNPMDNGYTGKSFIQDIYKTLGRLGGMEWLLIQARSDPRSFIGLLKNSMPKNLNIEQDTQLSVTLVDRFGNEKADWSDRQNAEATLEYSTPLLTMDDQDASEYIGE